MNNNSRELLSLDTLIRELEPYKDSPVRRMSRRAFTTKSFALGLGALVLGGIIQKTVSYMSSPTYLVSELEDLSDLPLGKKSERKEILLHLEKKLLEETWVPAARNAMDVIRARKKFNYVPARFENGKCEPEEAMSAEAGYFPRLLLHLGLVLEREDFIEDYKYIMNLLEFVPGPGYRIFRLMDPIQEFLKVSEKIGASQELIDKNKRLFQKCGERIMDSHLVHAEGLTYFKASQELDVPSKGFRNIIRPAHHIAKHMIDFAPKEYESHLDALRTLLIHDGLVYDGVSFNDLGDRKLEIFNKIPGVYDRDNRVKIYANAIEQVLTIDLFFDYYNKTMNFKATNLQNLPEGKIIAGKMKSETGDAAHTTAKKVEDIRSTLHSMVKQYVDNVHKHGPGVEFLDAPQSLYGNNNWPFVFNSNNMVLNKRVVSDVQTPEEVLEILLRLISTKGLGILPSARYETDDYALTYRLPSDLYAIKLMHNYIESA